MIGKVFQAVLLKKDSELEKEYAKLFANNDVYALKDTIDSIMCDYSDSAVIHLFEDWLAMPPNNSRFSNYSYPYTVVSNPDNYKDEELLSAIVRWQARSNFKVKAGQVLYLSEYMISGPFYVNHDTSDFEKALKSGVVTELIVDEYCLGEMFNDDEQDYIIYARLSDGSFSPLEDGCINKYSFSCHKITSRSIKSISD